jgi:hypothetical protein
MLDSADTGGHRTRHQAASRRWGQYCVRSRRSFPNDVSKLSTAATIGHRLEIHGNLEVASTVSAASPYMSVISKMCFPRQCTQAWTLASLFPQESYHSITRSQRSLRDGAIIGAEASHGLVSDQTYSSFQDFGPRSPFPQKSHHT